MLLCVFSQNRISIFTFLDLICYSNLKSVGSTVEEVIENLIYKCYRGKFFGDDEKRKIFEFQKSDGWTEHDTIEISAQPW